MATPHERLLQNVVPLTASDSPVHPVNEKRDNAETR